MQFLPVPPRLPLVHSLLASKTAARHGLCQELRVFFYPRKKRARFLQEMKLIAKQKGILLHLSAVVIAGICTWL